MGRGSSIAYGAIVLTSEAESIDNLVEALGEVLDKYGYPGEKKVKVEKKAEIKKAEETEGEKKARIELHEEMERLRKERDWVKKEDLAQGEELGR